MSELLWSLLQALLAAEGRVNREPEMPVLGDPNRQEWLQGEFLSYHHQVLSLARQVSEKEGSKLATGRRHMNQAGGQGAHGDETQGVPRVSSRSELPGHVVEPASRQESRAGVAGSWANRGSAEGTKRGECVLHGAGGHSVVGREQRCRQGARPVMSWVVARSRETRAGVVSREGTVLEGPGRDWEHRQEQGLPKREAVFLQNAGEANTYKHHRYLFTQW